jgi:exonuclease III
LITGDIELNPGPKDTPDLIENVLSIYHGNIRSLRNKINYITNLIEEFDIVCVTETHLNNQITDDDIAISGFDIPFRKDRNSHGGGIIMYHKSNVNILRHVVK